MLTRYKEGLSPLKEEALCLEEAESKCETSISSLLLPQRNSGSFLNIYPHNYLSKFLQKITILQTNKQQQKSLSAAARLIF